MPSYILPTIGANGVYQLKAPFDHDLTPGVAYTCLSIRSLPDLIGAGEDPFAKIYAPKSLTDVIYNQDLADGVSVVGLQSGTGDWVYVPVSYIASYPNGSGVPYTAIMIGVSLGAIPDSLDISALQSELVVTCQNVLGVLAACRAAVVSKTQLIDEETHEQLETIRLNRATTSASTEVLIADLRNQLQLATSKVSSLEAYIIERNLIAAASTSASISASTSTSTSASVSNANSISTSQSMSISLSTSISSSLSTGT